MIENENGYLPRTLAEAELEPGIFLFPGRWEGRIREMTTADEDLLLRRRPGREWENMNQLLQNCLQEQKDVLDLLIGDRLFLMYAIRKVTYGDGYAFGVTCSSCGERYEWEENIADLPVRYLSDPTYADPKHIFEFRLPRSGKLVKWRLGRGRDELRLRDLQREHRDNLMTALLYTRIAEIEGEKTVTLQAIASLPASDAAALRAEIEAQECGLETTITVECPACGMREEIALPLDPSFFSLRTTKRRTSTL